MTDSAASAAPGTSLGYLVRFETKPECAEEFGALLSGAALELARAEEGTTVWFPLRLGPTSFGVFDAFPDEAARQVHLHGRIADLLRAEGPRLLAQSVKVQPVDVLAAKLP
ncbi:putative quinol monooxygenase [Streptacidiphilus neutrinimicus]|uniref:putative quinol monooxygenase n=1 Tax=Streptacidiphilus neutrinimicus TaxID=105420 RepID=UPI000AA54D71|nr:antibiotic biosynthesis monooxygenase [Streptacidiphilus neutrinimicus]